MGVVLSSHSMSLDGFALIDELRFWVHPAVWGPGERPFEGDEQLRLELLDSRTFDSGVTLLRDAPARGAQSNGCQFFVTQPRSINIGR
jgi:dihydrofolate reductase